ncbi:MAG TPA: hypothetical protein VMU95_00665 [Trebonia sp.]|nr:hypothetical protein [Trebonia sp.]
MLQAVAAIASSTQNSTSTVNDVEPGVLGFLVVAALGLALYFLLRSMNRHLRKLGPKPEEDILSMDDLQAGEGAPVGAVAGEVLARQDGQPTADALPTADTRPAAGA